MLHGAGIFVYTFTQDMAPLQAGWWFGTHILFFYSVGNVILPIDFHIFPEG